MTTNGLVILDRDGVLNAMVIHPDHGTIDSPLHPSQVQVYPWVPQALRVLAGAGYQLAIATNQPAAAKGKTTHENLVAVHDEVIRQSDASFMSSHICFHTHEDGCLCRKPKPGLLQEALKMSTGVDPSVCWMVGDGVHDIAAGQSVGVNTAFIGPKKWDAKKVFTDQHLQPTLWVENLLEFAERLTQGKIKDGQF